MCSYTDTMIFWKALRDRFKFKLQNQLRPPVFHDERYWWLVSREVFFNLSQNIISQLILKIGLIRNLLPRMVYIRYLRSFTIQYFSYLINFKMSFVVKVNDFNSAIQFILINLKQIQKGIFLGTLNVHKRIIWNYR